MAPLTMLQCHTLMLRADASVGTHKCPNMRLMMRKESSMKILKRQLQNFINSITSMPVIDEERKSVKLKIHFHHIDLFHRKRWPNVSYSPGKGIHIRSGTASVTKKIKHKTQILLCILCAQMLELMDRNESVTVRNMYYWETGQLRDQVHGRDMIHDIAATLRVPRFFLHAYGSGWGSICGQFTWRTSDNSFDAYGVMMQNVPEAQDILSITSKADFVLVVETDATAQALAKQKLQYSMNCIIIASRGFPDSNTRQMVHLLWSHLQIPVFVLTDSDPSGMEIMCCYRFGSLSMAYESDQTVCPAVRWLGIFPDQVDKRNLLAHRRESFSRSDRKVIRYLMERPYIQSNKQLLRCLKTMDKRQEKVELEAFTHRGIKYLAEELIPESIRTGRWM